ncbi:MAG: adenosylmethionine decarboxylase [Myxococcota bacterium]
MDVSVVTGVLTGCPFEKLDSPEALGDALSAMVAAGQFTELNRTIHRFEPQGVTAMVVLAESHVAIHSWPENGSLFVDIASCTGMEPARNAFKALCSAIEHARAQHDERSYAA